MPRLITTAFFLAACMLSLAGGYYVGFQAGYHEGRVSTGVYNRLPDNGRDSAVRLVSWES